MKQDRMDAEAMTYEEWEQAGDAMVERYYESLTIRELQTMLSDMDARMDYSPQFGYLLELLNKKLAAEA